MLLGDSAMQREQGGKVRDYSFEAEPNSKSGQLTMFAVYGI